MSSPGLPVVRNGELGAVPDPMEPGDRGGANDGVLMGSLLYVMGVRGVTPAGAGGYGAVPDPGDAGDPGAPEASQVSSTLYQWNGTVWSAALEMPGEIGRTVFGTSAQDVFAVSNGVGGAVHMYHFNGSVWARQPLPSAPVAPGGAMGGKPGDIFFRAGESVFHFDGRVWRIVHASPALRGGGALVYIAPDEVYAIGNHGHARWEGASWRWQDFPALGVVEHAWGMRDANGALAMVATGTCAMNHVRVWKFTEHVAGTMVGSWGTAQGVDLNDPDASRLAVDPCPGPGIGTAIWGTSTQQLYASGAHHGDCGRFYAMNAGTWTPLWKHNSTPPPNDIIAGHAGDLWMPLANGQLMHAVPPKATANGAPDCSGAVADPDVLTRRDQALAPIRINGITDPEGGVVTLRVTEVTQDEPVTSRHGDMTCPDAALSAEGVPMVRAERDAHGNGRVYRIAFEATDEQGNIAGGFVKVCVPKNAHWECVDEGLAIRSFEVCPPRPPRPPRGCHEIAVAVTPLSGASSRFEVSLPEAADVRFVAFDVAGRRVATLGDGRWEAGVRTVDWRAEGIPAGLYFCRLTAGGVTVTKTVLVNR